MSVGFDTEATVDSGTRQLATYYVGDLLLGVPIEQVQEINRYLDITRVPHAPKSIRGVINLRGEVMPVVDLPVMLGMSPAEITSTTRNVVIQSQGQLLGLLVDRIGDILSIHDEKIIPPPTNGVSDRFFEGAYHVDADIVLILNPDEVLSDP